MAKVGDQAHTAHGLGTIKEQVLERGRKSFRVAGRNFSVWIPEQQIRVANGDVGFSYQNFGAPYQDEEHQELSMLGGLDSTIIPGAPYEVNQKNHTTLPYNPTPQYHSDMYRQDGTILPGDQEIDASDRLHPSDSLSGKNKTVPKGPQPNPDLFVPRSDHPFADQRTSNLHHYAEDHEARGKFRTWLDGPERDPGTPEYDWVNDPAFHGGDPMIGPKMTSEGYDDHVKSHPDHHERVFASRPAGLNDRYAYVQAEAEANTPRARFRHDPVGFIRTCGHLWTDGDMSLEKYADYTNLLDAEAIRVGGIERTAAWADVRAKGLRLRHEGKVDVHEMDHANIYASVQGDNGTYDVMLAKSAGSQGIDDWACSCEWGRWAFKRQMTYVGRLCSHAYAAYQELNSEHHKGNPGRFQKSADILSDYKSYLSNNGQAPEAASVATFLNTQGNNASKDEVEKLYGYISNNPEECEERNFKTPYGNDPDAAYKQADLLRTKPQSLSPNLRNVPEGEGQQWMDVTKDERETTGPDQIMHFSYVQNLRNLHGGPSQGISDFFSGGGGIGDPSTSGASAPAPATPTAPVTPTVPSPSTSPAPTGGDDSSINSDDPLSSAAGWGKDLSGAMPFMKDMSNPNTFVDPFGHGGGTPTLPTDDIKGAESAGDLLGQDTEKSNANFGKGGSLHEADILQQIRDLDAPEDDLGHMDERNDHVRDLLNKAEDEGYGASQFVAAYDDDREKTPSDGNGDFLGQSAPGFPDKGFAGVGPDPKDWFSDSAGYVDENEKPHYSDADWHAPDSSDIIKFNDSRSKPQQGPRQANNFNPSTTFADVNAGPMGASPDMGESMSSGADMSTDNITAMLHHSDAGTGSDGFFNPNNAGASDWEEGSGEPFMNDVSNAADKMKPQMPGEDPSKGGDSGGDAAEGGEAAEGSELADAAVLASLHQPPQHQSDMEGYSASQESSDGGGGGMSSTAAFSVEAFDAGGFDASALGGAGGGTGELRRAARLGNGPRSQVRIDPGFRGGNTPEQRQANQAPPPEDFGFDGGLEKEAFLMEDTGADIVADFHRSGAAAGMMGGSQQSYSTSSGGYDDFSSSPMVQAMQRTAGRVFSPEDQRRLESENHPLGARNMPTNEDLAGTHYLL